MTQCRGSDPEEVDPWFLFDEQDQAKLDTPQNAPSIKRDLADIKERGKLVALTTFSSTTYFMYRGRPMGFEYELLKRLAKELDVKLEIRIVKNLDEIFQMLNDGEGDLIAYNLTVTRSRSQMVDFTEHLMTSRQMLVQRKPEGWRQMTRDQIHDRLIRNPLELEAETVYVRKETSYFERLQALQDEIGGEIHVKTVPGKMETEKLIQMVADGAIDYTVADEEIARLNATYHKNLDVGTPISFPQRVAWAVRENSPELKAAVNDWLRREKKTLHYALVYNKYFKNRKAFNKRFASDSYVLRSGKISAYDDLIKEYAQKIDYDWRLVTAQIYQESRFRPKVKSWMGAVGLMQVLPSTAARFGIRNLRHPESNIKAGTAYLGFLDRFWKKHIADSAQRLRFVLASYNAGLGHVADARRLAKKYGRNPDIWENNVDTFLLLKAQRRYYLDPVSRYGYCRGSEPYKYVREILERYQSYRQFFREQQMEADSNAKLSHRLPAPPPAPSADIPFSWIPNRLPYHPEWITWNSFIAIWPPRPGPTRSISPMYTWSPRWPGTWPRRVV